MNPQDIDNLIKLLNEVKEQQTQLTQYVKDLTVNQLKDIIKEVIREEMSHTYIPVIPQESWPTHFPNTPWSATNKGE